MSKRRRSYATRTGHDGLPEDGIAAKATEKTGPGLVVLNTPLRRLIFFAGLTGFVALIVATAMLS